MTFNLSIKTLKTVIVCYLAIPFYVFFITWLKLLFSVPLCLILSYCLLKYIAGLSKEDFIKIPVFQAVVSSLIVLVWVGISGNGGMGVQWNDLIKPVAISKDIMLHGNPILYQEPSTGASFFLCQYMAFYIVIPTIFGFLPWKALMFITFLYVYFGAMLGIVWFWHLSGSFSPFFTLFFVFFCGIDFAGFAYTVGLKQAIVNLKNDFYAYQPFWGNAMIDPKMPFMYQSNTHSLFWGPQHALANWIGMGMFTYDFIHKKDLEKSPFYLALLVFLSPFIVLGITPFLLYAAFKKGIFGFFSWQNILMLPVVLMVVWYMSSLPLATIESGPIFYRSARLLGYLAQLKAFLIFWLADVGVWVMPVLLFFIKSKDKPSRDLAILAAVVLTVIPLYRFGIYNDWSQRVSMPGLFLVSVLVVKTFRASKTPMRAFLIGVFCVSIWDPFYFISHSIKTNGVLRFSPNEYAATPTYYDACKMSKYPLYQNVAPVSASFYQIACKKK